MSLASRSLRSMTTLSLVFMLFPQGLDLRDQLLYLGSDVSHELYISERR